MPVEPPDSSETAMSSSVIAEAIQSASRWRTRSESAVTRPPPPRRTVRSPFSSRSNWAGPRFETMISGEASTAAEVTCSVQAAGELPPAGRRSGFEPGEQLEPVAQQPRREELAPRVLLALAAKALAEARVAQDLEATLGTLLGRVDEVA